MKFIRRFLFLAKNCIRNFLYGLVPYHLRRTKYSNDIFIEIEGFEENLILKNLKGIYYRQTIYGYSFKYRNHDFFAYRNHRKYEIIDALTGLTTNIKIKKINKLKKLKNDNEIDAFLTKILLNSSDYREQIKRFLNSPIWG